MIAEIVTAIVGMSAGAGGFVAGNAGWNVASSMGANFLMGPVRRAIETARGPHNGDLQDALAAAFESATEQLAKQGPAGDVRLLAEQLHANAISLFPDSRIAPEDRLPEQEKASDAVLDALLFGDRGALRETLTTYLAPCTVGEATNGWRFWRLAE